MLPAVIAFDFDPRVTIGGIVILWKTLALAAIIVLAVGLTAIRAGAISPRLTTQSRRAQRADQRPRLDREVLLYILLGAVPGAILAGRLGYIAVHTDYYRIHPLDAFDPGQGSLQLSLAVLGGTLTAALVAGMFRAPIRPWLHVAAVPLLLALGLGKLAMALDAEGQGAMTDLPWATAYLGPGPWASLGPAIPSHPAQIYEGLLTLLVAGVLVALLRAGRLRTRDGQLFHAGVLLWTVVRLAVAFTWADPLWVGPLRADQIVTAWVGLVAAGMLWLSVRHGSEAASSSSSEGVANTS